MFCSGRWLDASGSGSPYLVLLSGSELRGRVRSATHSVVSLRARSFARLDTLTCSLCKGVTVRLESRRSIYGLGQGPCVSTLMPTVSAGSLPVSKNLHISSTCVRFAHSHHTSATVLTSNDPRWSSPSLTGSESRVHLGKTLLSRDTPLGSDDPRCAAYETIRH